MSFKAQESSTIENGGKPGLICKKKELSAAEVTVVKQQDVDEL